MGKYKVLRTFGHATKGTVREGTVVELDDKEAAPLAKIKAIGLYFEDDDAPEPVTQKRRAPPRKRRKMSDPKPNEEVSH